MGDNDTRRLKAIQCGLHGKHVTANPASGYTVHRVHYTFVGDQEPGDLLAQRVIGQGGFNFLHALVHQELRSCSGTVGGDYRSLICLIPLMGAESCDGRAKRIRTIGIFTNSFIINGFRGLPRG